MEEEALGRDRVQSLIGGREFSERRPGMQALS
jgi:hypothetical protein